MGETDCARKTVSLFPVWRKSSLGLLVDFGADTPFSIACEFITRRESRESVFCAGRNNHSGKLHIRVSAIARKFQSRQLQSVTLYCSAAVVKHATLGRKLFLFLEEGDVMNLVKNTTCLLEYGVFVCSCVY